MKYRVYVNGIRFLMNEVGERMSNYEDVNNEVVNFYKNFLGLFIGFLFVIDKWLIRKGVMLSCE